MESKIMSPGHQDGSDEVYDREEAQCRFDAALRGTRAVGPLPVKELSPKRPSKRNTKAAPGVNPEPKD
jgi:hypothetical protein